VYPHRAGLRLGGDPGGVLPLQPLELRSPGVVEIEPVGEGGPGVLGTDKSRVEVIVAGEQPADVVGDVRGGRSRQQAGGQVSGEMLEGCDDPVETRQRDLPHRRGTGEHRCQEPLHLPTSRVAV
jgi:hypothetical protein